MKSTGLQDSNPDQMPASQKPLGTDKEGTEFAEQWSYSSVVGMLLYLKGTQTKRMLLQPTHELRI